MRPLYGSKLWLLACCNMTCKAVPPLHARLQSGLAESFQVSSNDLQNARALSPAFPLICQTRALGHLRIILCQQPVCIGSSPASHAGRPGCFLRMGLLPRGILSPRTCGCLWPARHRPLVTQVCAAAAADVLNQAGEPGGRACQRRRCRPPAAQQTPRRQAGRSSEASASRGRGRSWPHTQALHDQEVLTELATQAGVTAKELYWQRGIRNAGRRCTERAPRATGSVASSVARPSGSAKPAQHSASGTGTVKAVWRTATGAAPYPRRQRCERAVSARASAAGPSARPPAGTSGQALSVPPAARPALQCGAARRLHSRHIAWKQAQLDSCIAAQRGAAHCRWPQPPGPGAGVAGVVVCRVARRS